MELKSIISFEEEKEGRLYRLEIPNEAPLGDAYVAVSSFLVKIAELIRDHAANTAPKDPEEVEVEEEDPLVQDIEEVEEK